METLRQRGETITLATSRAFATVIGRPPGYNAVELEAPSSTIENILVGFGPKIRGVYFYDASVPRWQNYTSEATDRNTASLVDLSVMQTADRLYVGAVKRYGGISVDVVGTNGAGTATLTGEYPDASDQLTWTDLSITDGTVSTRTLAQDGLITFTSPANNGWDVRTLAEVAGETLAAPKTEKLFWIRLRPSAALTDTSITVAELTALFDDTLNSLTGDNTGEDEGRFLSHNGGKPPAFFRLSDKHGSIELTSASITSAANVTWLEVR